VIGGHCIPKERVNRDDLDRRPNQRDGAVPLQVCVWCLRISITLLQSCQKNKKREQRPRRKWQDHQRPPTI
jgi:hypothetical protein